MFLMENNGLPGGVDVPAAGLGAVAAGCFAGILAGFLFGLFAIALMIFQLCQK